MPSIDIKELRVLSPCTTAEWSDKGDDLSRHCATCDKHVYNLSVMTHDEANALIREKQGKLCIKLFHDRNGNVLTADSPIYLRLLRRKYLIARAKFIGLALMLLGLVTGTSSCTESTVTLGIPATKDNFHYDVDGKHHDTFVAAAFDSKNRDLVLETFDSTIWVLIDSTEQKPGSYDIPHVGYEAGGFRDSMDAPSKFLWYIGVVTIDSINYYVENERHVGGSFWFNAIRTSPPFDTVFINKGSFDVPIH